MGRAPCCEKMGLNKGPWTPKEDQILISFIGKHGHSNWRALPKQAGLLRCGKSCRLRWMNYLKPDIKRGNFTKDEEDAIINLHTILGNRWSAIAAKLPGRTDNEIKNVWHTHLKKRLQDYTPSKPKPNNKKKVTKPKSKSKITNSNSSRTDSELENSFSPSSSTSEVSSVTLMSHESHNNETKNDSELGNISMTDLLDGCTFENFGSDIDESFWNEVLYSQDQHNYGTNVQGFHNNATNGLDETQQGYFHDQQLGFVDNEMVLDSEMDFWFDVLARTGGEQDLLLDGI